MNILALFLGISDIVISLGIRHVERKRAVYVRVIVLKVLLRGIAIRREVHGSSPFPFQALGESLRHRFGVTKRF
jgi:uncharacterized membrane protein